ncbi:hypothetical protein BM477_00430 [Boudabousia marimammalium]|uniref:Uncharacterized protein n=1 Tax=Boudabousia marimammalium TaxID=156892 RepID=A0A1Q5PSD8_9ACTO|nr:hypothetical protein BM477_00430 [Boudabousia marimammalium]
MIDGETDMLAGVFIDDVAYFDHLPPLGRIELKIQCSQIFRVSTGQNLAMIFPCQAVALLAW